VHFLLLLATVRFTFVYAEHDITYEELHVVSQVLHNIILRFDFCVDRLGQTI